MPFDPAKPANNSPNSSAEMRGQLTALNTDIQTRATNADLANAIASAISGTSNNTNGVGTLDSAPSDPPTFADYETLRAKLNELILNGRR